MKQTQGVVSTRAGVLRVEVPAGVEVVTATELAKRAGVPVCVVVRYCKQGVIGGAWRDRRTWRWQIPVRAHGA